MYWGTQEGISIKHILNRNHKYHDRLEYVSTQFLIYSVVSRNQELPFVIHGTFNITIYRLGEMNF